MFTALGKSLYKYVMLMCNCRSEFQSDIYSSPVLESTALSNGEAFSGGSSEEAKELFKNVDELLEGTDSDKTQAYNLLSDREQQVGLLPVCMEVWRDSCIFWKHRCAFF